MAKSLEDKINDNHIVFITSKMSPKQVSETILKILGWSEIDDEQVINIYLTGECRYSLDYLAIYDVLNSINNPINVFCFGLVSGYTMIFLALPHRGKRYGLRHGAFELAQPYGSMSFGVNQETEIGIEAKRLSEDRAVFEEILSKGLNKPLEVIHQDVENDHEMTAEEALEYGLIDEILE